MGTHTHAHTHTELAYLEIPALNQAETLCMYLGIKNSLSQTSIFDVTSDIGETTDVIFQRLVVEWDFLCGFPTFFFFFFNAFCGKVVTDSDAHFFFMLCAK